MASSNVICRDCHQVEQNYPGAEAHEGTFILASPTAAVCQRCHQNEVVQFNQSRHSLPAYVAYNGTDGLTDIQMRMYQSIPEGQYSPSKARNQIAAREGTAITAVACAVCHSVGQPAADGSVGQCQKCHLRHEFSLAQSRKPETCNNCHIGPDHPQWEIYVESPHGVAYHTSGDTWNWSAEPGTLTTSDFPAPTCATCHISGFGAAGTTHDVGDRLGWYLFAPVSERRPAYQDNITRMQAVCYACHSENFVVDFYKGGDAAVSQVSDWVNQGNQIYDNLTKMGATTSEPFDQPVDFVQFELWHHYGRTAKFGAWMQGPDYTQWHGAYEMLSDLADLQQMYDEMVKNQNAGTVK